MITVSLVSIDEQRVVLHVQQTRKEAEESTSIITNQFVNVGLGDVVNLEILPYYQGIKDVMIVKQDENFTA